MKKNSATDRAKGELTLLWMDLFQKREILPYLFAVIATLVSIWLLFLAALTAFETLFSSSCSLACIVEDPEVTCCAMHWKSLALFAFFALATVAGSAFGTRITKRYKFRASASATALQVISLVAFLLRENADNWLIVIAAIITYFAMFLGYRQGLKLK